MRVVALNKISRVATNNHFQGTFRLQTCPDIDKLCAKCEHIVYLWTLGAQMGKIANRQIQRMHRGQNPTPNPELPK